MRSITNIAFNVAFVALMLTFSTGRSEMVETNWNGLSFQLVMPQTNWFIGDSISASLVMSNAAASKQIVRWNTGDVCGCGFGLFEIVNLSSGKQIKCHIPDNERTVMGAGMVGLIPNQSYGFDANLVAGYSLTNSGLYSVRGIHYFYVTEPPTPTNRQTIPVVTPPIIISLSPKTDANSPPK